MKTPDNPSFVFWIRAVQRLQNFSLFGEFMAEKAAPHLFNICEQILNDKNNQMQIKINNYFYHYGQYTDTRNTVQKKKNDLLLQIIRILNKCE
jgi:3-methyladenine DNA glycosylase AlkD